MNGSKDQGTSSQQLRDRVKDLRRVRAGDLIPSDRNWRKHPQAQRDALRGMLEEVGIADALIAREADKGLVLIDGHLRRDLDPEQVVPVLVLDVTEAEADKLLLTLDPLAAMAEADSAALDALMRDVQTGSQAVADMLEELAEKAKVAPIENQPTPTGSKKKSSKKDRATCPECGHEFTP